MSRLESLILLLMRALRCDVHTLEQTAVQQAVATVRGRQGRLLWLNGAL